jgi:hypothetical protein
MYLSTHNTLRGFDKRTIRANFFRSILAWPLSVTFAPIGNALFIPSIVQAKFWSDFVAAIIEGSGKYRNIIKVKDQIMKKLIPELTGENEETEKLALMDLIFFVNESRRAKTAMRKQLIPQQSRITRLKKVFFRNKFKTVPNESYYELQKRMDSPNKFNELIDYIIEHYYREQSLYLVKMVSKNYYKLQKWLSSISK